MVAAHGGVGIPVRVDHTSRHAAPLKVARRAGLIVEMPNGVTALAVTPGFLRCEAMREHFGVTEATWQEGARMDPHFIASETPFYVGWAVAALAADPQGTQKSGQAFSSWGLMEEYGFTDIDGRQPHWGKYFAEHVVGRG